MGATRANRVCVGPVVGAVGSMNIDHAGVIIRSQCTNDDDEYNERKGPQSCGAIKAKAWWRGDGNGKKFWCTACKP